MKSKATLACILALMILAMTACSSNRRIVDERNLTVQEYSILNTVGRDALGRFSDPSDSVKSDKKRYVGLFYFLIHNQASDMKGIYDVTKILNRYGRDFFNSDTDISPSGMCHVWGEPVWGYYGAPDEWVMRRQIEMFVFSGIDFLVLDCSNGPLFEEVTDVLFSLIAEYRSQGWNAPQIVYQLNGGGKMENDVKQLKTVYNTYYAQDKYRDIWFAPEGKPMVICLEKTQVYLEKSPEAAQEERELARFFQIKNSYWPTDISFTDNSVPWMDFDVDPKVMGNWISVSVAQHVGSKMSDSISARGRGWTLENGNDHENFAAGANLEHQWDNAIAKGNEIQYVFVTGWNEWGAQKMYRPDMDPINGYVMIDQFNDEFSRDIEPTYSSGMKDNFYLQNLRKVREWKYERARRYEIPALSPSDVADESWKDAAKYADFTGEAIYRDAPRFDGAYTGERLTDRTARNDISAVDVARDGENLYFRIAATKNITPYQAGDTGWMNIHIRTESAESAAWGYNYVIRENGRVMSVQNGVYSEEGKAETAVVGNQMYVSVPLKLLRLSRDRCSIEFKVSDNVGDPLDVLSFYNSGDSAPIGGLSWSFGY